MNRRDLLTGALALSTVSIIPTKVSASNDWDELHKWFTKTSREYLFELNDLDTRFQFRLAMHPFCQSKGFKMKCDSTNNTPEIIDANDFVADFSRDGIVRRYSVQKDMVEYTRIEYINNGAYIREIDLG